DRLKRAETPGPALHRARQGLCRGAGAGAVGDRPAAYHRVVPQDGPEEDHEHHDDLLLLLPLPPESGRGGDPGNRERRVRPRAGRPALAGRRRVPCPPENSRGHEAGTRTARLVTLGERGVNPLFTSNMRREPSLAVPRTTLRACPPSSSRIWTRSGWCSPAG